MKKRDVQMKRFSRKPHKVFSVWLALSYQYLDVSDALLEAIQAQAKPLTRKLLTAESDRLFGRHARFCRINLAIWR